MISSLPLVHLQSIPAKSVIIHKKNNSLHKQIEASHEESNTFEPIKTEKEYSAMEYYLYSIGSPVMVACKSSAVLAYADKDEVCTEVVCPKCGKRANFLTRSLFGNWQCPYCRYADDVRFEFIVK